MASTVKANVSATKRRTPARWLVDSRTTRSQADSAVSVFGDCSGKPRSPCRYTKLDSPPKYARRQVCKRFRPIWAGSQIVVGRASSVVWYDMRVYSERTQVLLTPGQRQALARLAEEQQVSVGAVIRAAIDAYLIPTRRDRRVALDQLFSVGAPAPDWDTMKREIETGVLGEAS